MAPDPPEDTRSTPLSPETPEPSLQVSMSAARAEDPEALSSRVEGARQQLAEVIDEMHAVLAWDLPVYPEREGKKRFLDAPEKAAEMAEGELAAIKKELRGVGSGIAAQVAEALRSHGPWQSEEASAEEGGARSLDGNPEVTAALYRVARATQAVLARCGLASAEESLRGLVGAAACWRCTACPWPDCSSRRWRGRPRCWPPRGSSGRRCPARGCAGSCPWPGPRRRRPGPGATGARQHTRGCGAGR